MNDIAFGTIIGRLGRDGELSHTSSGQALLKFAVATNHGVKTDQGYADEATWWKGTLWGKQAEAVAQYMTKGKQVGVSGEIYLENWTSRDGEKKQSLCINATSVQLLGDAKEGQGRVAQREQAPRPAERQPTRQGEDFTDSIPFN